MQRMHLLVTSRTSATLDAYSGAVKDFLGEFGQQFTFSGDYCFRSLNDLCCLIDVHATSHDLRNTVVIVEIVEEEPVPILSSERFPTFTEELVLRYPEIYFIFMVTPSQHTAVTSRCSSVSGIAGRERILDRHFVLASDFDRLFVLLRHYAGGFRNLMDATLLRWAVSRLMVFPQYSAPLHDLVQASIGTTIEDEEAQCIFSGYTLYRRGIGTYIVTTGEEFERLFPEDISPAATPEPVAIPKKLPGSEWVSFDHILEDVELAFADREQLFLESNSLLPNLKTPPLDALRARATHRKALRECLDRTILSVIAPPKHLGGGMNWAQKPIGGIYDDELSKFIGRQPLDILRSDNSHPDETATRHSAPGRIRLIAEDLIARAEHLLNQKTTLSMRDAIYGAVLAEEALRLLGSQSPQLSLEALEFREEAEVSAECAFTGTTRYLRSDERMMAQKRMVQTILRSGENISWRCDNALVSIVGDVRRIYGEFERYDEEQDCLNQIRTLENNLYRRSRGSVVGALSFSGRWYMNFLFEGGVTGISLAVLILIMVFGVLYSTSMPNLSACKGLQLSAFIWFTTQPPTGLLSDSQHVPWWSLFENAAAFLHLAILASYLYDRVLRD